MRISWRPRTLKRELNLFFMVGGSLFLALATIVLFLNGEADLRRRLLANATTAAETAAALVGTQEHGTIRSPGDLNSAAFRQIVTELSAVRRAHPSIIHLFTLAPSSRLGSWGVVVDMGGTAPERDPSLLVRGRLPIGAAPPSSVPEELLDRAMAGTTAEILNFPEPQRARVVAVAPIRTDEGASVGLAVVELSAEDLVAEMRSLALLSVTIFLVGLLLSAVASHFAARWITRPVVGLLHAVDELARGNLKVRVTARSTNELGALAAGFNQMAQSLEASQSRSLEQQARLRDLHRLGSQVAGTLDLRRMLDSAAAGMRAICGGDEVHAGVRESRAKPVSLWVCAGGGEIPGAAEWSADVETLERVVGPDSRLLTRAELTTAGLDFLLSRPGDYALAAPLRVSDTTIGILVALGAREQFHHDAVSLASLLAGQVAASVGNAHLFDQIRAVDRSKSEFLSIASHEVRTPLTVMKSSLDILVTNPRFQYTADQRQLIAFCQESVERLIRLVRDILDVSKIEAGVLSVQFLPVSLNELVEKCLFWVPQLPGGHGIEVEARLPSQPAMVLADGGRITQVLENLISNAIKFSKPGGRITIELREHEREFEVIVRDQGKGIAREDLDRIFGKFYQVADSATREQGGTGLGLAICRGIIEAHRGRIWAESVIGDGSSFHFTLARAPELTTADRSDAEISVASLLSSVRTPAPRPAGRA